MRGGRVEGRRLFCPIRRAQEIGCDVLQLATRSRRGLFKGGPGVKRTGDRGSRRLDTTWRSKDLLVVQIWNDDLHGCEADKGDVTTSGRWLSFVAILYACILEIER